MRASDIVKKKDNVFKGEAAQESPFLRESDMLHESANEEPSAAVLQREARELGIPSAAGEASAQDAGFVVPPLSQKAEEIIPPHKPVKKESGFRLSDLDGLESFFSPSQLSDAKGVVEPVHRGTSEYAPVPEPESAPEPVPVQEPERVADSQAAAAPLEAETVPVAETAGFFPSDLFAERKEIAIGEDLLPTSPGVAMQAPPQVDVFPEPIPVPAEPKEPETFKDLYIKAQQYLYAVKKRVSNDEPIDIASAIEIIQDIIEMPRGMDAEIYQVTVDSGQGDDYFLSHAVNTAIYAVRIGQRLEYSKPVLLELGLAALLCDIGMFKIPDSIVNKEEKLSQSEIDLIKSHAQMGRDIMMPFRDRYPALLDAILEHQERENGNGYPRGLKGDEISEFAKIIGICDSFEAMTHNRPHKKALVQTESIRELIGAKNQLFSPRIIKAFLDEVSIFPIGSYVRLNNRNIGRVISTNRSNPLKPTIRLLYDDAGRKFIDQKVIELSRNPVLNIEESVALDELPA